MMHAFKFSSFLCMPLPPILAPLPHVFSLVSHPRKAQNISLERINSDGDKLSRFDPGVLVVELG